MRVHHAAAAPPQCPSTRPRPNGFTAIELMITIAILGILLALAAPSFTPIIEKWRARSAAEELQSTIYYARSEAIKRGGGITVAANTGGWLNGWIVTHTQGATVTTLQEYAAHSNTAITVFNKDDASKTSLFVDRWGMVNLTKANDPAELFSALIAPKGKDATAIASQRLCIALAGRIQRVDAKTHKKDCTPN